METRLPVEVELVYEVMSCQAMRCAQEPIGLPHPCSYFRRWGTYHSYDYTTDDPPPERGIVHETRYVGRAPLVPELLSGCRKAPIMAVGINPNTPGWWAAKRGSLSPLFDDYRQYAHYFRYRTLAKLELEPKDYEKYAPSNDTPFSGEELTVPATEGGDRIVRVRLQKQKMYEGYQDLLDGMAAAMGWPDHELTVGEDLTYGNMVASPSAKWTTKPAPDSDPLRPPMSVEERDGIVSECFRKRKYFLRQLFQSLPRVLLIFSQSTANAFIGELAERFTVGAPRQGEPIEELMKREFRVKYGDLPDDAGTLDARVIFAPHITGDPGEFKPARERVVAQLVEEAQAGRVEYRPETKHLRRSAGACTFCTMLQIGACDYVEELEPISGHARLTADSDARAILEEKRLQAGLMADAAESGAPVAQAWAGSDDGDEHSPDDGSGPAVLRPRDGRL